jgi:hypothetical protein
MKHKEKLDKVLYLIYPHRYSGSQYLISEIMSEGGITYDDNEPRVIAKRLQEDGLIKAIFTFDGAYVNLTSRGIEYCEEESYSYPEKAVINLFSINNSPNTSIVVGNENVVNYNNKEEVQKIIEDLKLQISNNTELTETIVAEIGECLDEIDAKVENKTKIPRILLKGLLSTTADLTTVYPAIKTLIEKLT